jgi:thiosulfate reductase cytochrome b subunit
MEDERKLPENAGPAAGDGPSSAAGTPPSGATEGAAPAPEAAGPEGGAPGPAAQPPDEATAAAPAPGLERGAPGPATTAGPVAEPAAGVVAEPVAPAEPPVPEARPFVRRHHWIVRLTHWVNTVVLLGMMASGLQIYNAYERFGIRGTRLPVPNPFDMHPVPHWARLGGWLAGGLNWHFFLMWPLVLNGLLYLGYLLFTGEWRPLLFRTRDVGPAVEMQKYYLHLRREHPPQGKHNALQKGAYTFIVLLGILSVVTGLSLWKPVQLWWLTALFGGYELARYWHFVAVWLFVAFIVVHVVLVFTVDPASLRAMITGWYRGRFPSHD